MSYYLSNEQFNAITGFLSTHLDVHPSGAIGPARETPIQCYLPTHSSYKGDLRRMFSSAHGCQEAMSPRGVQRIQGNASSRRSIVFDRDISNTWRLPSSTAADQVFFWEQAFKRALVHETVFIVVEAFIEKEARDILDYDAEPLIACFRTYLKTLSTSAHTITITMRSIVEDMMEQASTFRGNAGEELAWRLPNMTENLTDFVLSRDCWQYEQGRLPSVKVTFEVPEVPEVFGFSRTRVSRHSRSNRTIKLHCHYAWFPPVLTFQHLENVTFESGKFVLKPSLATERPFACMSAVSITYYVGQEESWLR